VKHTDQTGQINILQYAHRISLMKSHQERMNYLDDIDENFVDLVYLTSMQMGIVNTIADLPTREERKKAWDELPEHTRSMKGMKDMVYHRVVRKFRST